MEKFRHGKGKELGESSCALSLQNKRKLFLRSHHSSRLREDSCKATKGNAGGHKTSRWRKRMWRPASRLRRCNEAQPPRLVEEVIPGMTRWCARRGPSGRGICCGRTRDGVGRTCRMRRREERGGKAVAAASRRRAVASLSRPPHLRTPHGKVTIVDVVRGNGIGRPCRV